MCATYLFKKKKTQTLVQSQAAARHDSLCQLSSPARSFSPRLLLSGSLVSQSPPPASATYRAVQQPVISSALVHTNKNTLKHHTLRSSGGSYLYTLQGDRWRFPMAKLWCDTSQTWLTHMVLGRMWKSICCWCRDDPRGDARGGKALKAAFPSLIHTLIVSTIFQQPSAVSQSSPPFPYFTLPVNEVNGS